MKAKVKEWIVHFQLITTELQEQLTILENLTNTFKASLSSSTSQIEQVVGCFYQWLWLMDFALELRTGEQRHLRHQPPSTPTKQQFKSVHTTQRKHLDQAQYTGQSVDDCNQLFQWLSQASSKVNEDKLDCFFMVIDEIDGRRLTGIEDTLRTIASSIFPKLAQDRFKLRIEGKDPHQKLIVIGPSQSSFVEFGRLCTDPKTCNCPPLETEALFDQLSTKSLQNHITSTLLTQLTAAVSSQRNPQDSKYVDESLDSIKLSCGINPETIDETFEHFANETKHPILANPSGTCSGSKTSLFNSSQPKVFCLRVLIAGNSSASFEVRVPRQVTIDGKVKAIDLYQLLLQTVQEHPNLSPSSRPVFWFSSQQLMINNKSPSYVSLEQNETIVLLGTLRQIYDKQKLLDGPESVHKAISTALEQFDRVLRSKKSSHLHLDLSGRGLRALHLQALFTVLNLRSMFLTRLSLANNDLSWNNAMKIVLRELDSGCLGQLEQLDLTRCSVWAPELVDLAKRLPPTVKEVRVDGNDIEDADFERFSREASAVFYKHVFDYPETPTLLSK